MACVVSKGFVSGGKLEPQGGVFKSARGTVVPSLGVAGGIQGPAPDTVVYVADPLAVVKLSVPAIIKDPDRDKKQQPGNQEACHEY